MANAKKKQDETQEEKLDSKPDKTATLLERILWVRDRVGTLGKDSNVSTGTGGRGYKAISHDKVTGYLRPKLNQAGIVSFMTCLEAKDVETGASTNKGRKIVQHQARFEISFVNVYDSTDKLTLQQFAYADDFGDKAPGKAASYAMKYSLLKLFMIETGEEDEERVEPDGGRAAVIADNESMLLDIWAVAEEVYGDGELASERLQAMAERRFHVENYGKIPQNRMNDAIRSLRQDAKRLKEQKEDSNE